MPGKVIGTQMNLGYPGTYARNPDCIIVNRIVSSTPSGSDGPNFGDPCVLRSDGTVSSVADFIAGSESFTAALFEGVAVREVKTDQTYPPVSNTNKYSPGQPCDVITRGNVSVLCRVGAPTAGGAVYVRTELNSSFPAGVVGGFEAAADSGKTVEVTNCKWATGLKDANSVTELAILTRNLP